MSKSTLRSKARILLSIADYLKLPHRPQGQISMQEIEKAATRWSRKRWTLHPNCLREQFVSETVAWLSFLGRLQVQTKPTKAYDQMLVEFKAFMEKDRGFSPVTVEHRCHSVRPFLDRLLSEERPLDMVSVADIDSLLAQNVNEHHYARVSIRGFASSLRAFFRYAEMRGWCGEGIAASIMDPRLIYVARTRNGFTPAMRGQLFRRFRGLETARCPFVNLPEARGGRWGQGLTAEKMKECQWLEPVLVGQFEYVEWTPDKICASYCTSSWVGWPFAGESEWAVIETLCLLRLLCR